MSPAAPLVQLEEQWVKAKYERQEFMDPTKKQSYQEKMKAGWLMKMGRENGFFLSRKFMLVEEEGTLKYYSTADAKKPKGVINVETMNTTFQPKKVGHPNGLQITYLKDHHPCNLCLYHDEGKVGSATSLPAIFLVPTVKCALPSLQEIVDWFNTIRAVQFEWFKLAFPTATDQKVGNFLKEGFMKKAGPKARCFHCTKRFKKCWFTLNKRQLLYFIDSLDAFPKGELFLGHVENGYSASLGFLTGTQSNGTWTYGITLKTPKCCFFFTCESEGDQQDWLDHFSAVNTISPQDRACKHPPLSACLFPSLSHS
ncbi:arf-GAP with dual PH domain-containing protein 1-like [Arapaima gigas]